MTTRRTSKNELVFLARRRKAAAHKNLKYPELNYLSTRGGEVQKKDQTKIDDLRHSISRVIRKYSDRVRLSCTGDCFMCPDAHVVFCYLSSRNFFDIVLESEEEEQKMAEYTKKELEGKKLAELRIIAVDVGIPRFQAFPMGKAAVTEAIMEKQNGGGESTEDDGDKAAAKEKAAAAKKAKAEKAPEETTEETAEETSEGDEPAPKKAALKKGPGKKGPAKKKKTEPEETSKETEEGSVEDEEAPEESLADAPDTIAPARVASQLLFAIETIVKGTLESMEMSGPDPKEIKKAVKKELTAGLTKVKEEIDEVTEVITSIAEKLAEVDATTEKLTEILTAMDWGEDADFSDLDGLHEYMTSD